MKHSEITLKLSAYVDNEVTPAQKTEIDTHLQSCPQCRLEIQQIRSQDQKIRKIPELTPFYAFRVKVNDAIDNQAPVKKAGWINVNKLIPIPLGLSLLVVVFSIYMIAAPVVYGMNNETVKAKAADMVSNAVLSCMAGSVFSPAAFARFYGACMENACSCIDGKCSKNCTMGGDSHGNEK